MKKTIIIISWFLIILLVSSFMAPLLYRFLDYKFHRILSRCVMVLFLLSAVVYFLKIDRINVKSLIDQYGLQWKKRASLGAMSEGFICSFMVLFSLMVIEVFIGARIIRVNIHSDFVIKVIQYVGAAFIVAFIEELFFRGMIFKKLTMVSLSAAFIITNVFYALVHFFKAKNYVIAENPNVFDSFRVIGALAKPFSDPVAILPGFIGLFIFGLVLSYVYWRTKSLYHSIGIHAGCVFFLKADGFLLNTNDSMPQIIYGDKYVYTGILGWIFIVFIGLIMMFIIKRREDKMRKKS